MYCLNRGNNFGDDNSRLYTANRSADGQTNWLLDPLPSALGRSIIGIMREYPLRPAVQSPRKRSMGAAYVQYVQDMQFTNAGAGSDRKDFSHVNERRLLRKEEKWDFVPTISFASPRMFLLEMFPFD